MKEINTMNCVFVPTDQQHVYRCTACNRTWKSTRHGPEAMHRECNTGGPSLDQSPGDQSRGLGDTVAKVTTAFGIKPCGACKRRQEKMND